jgi:hypothetical protein
MRESGRMGFSGTTGVHCAPGEGREVVRELYVARRRQVQALGDAGVGRAGVTLVLGPLALSSPRIFGVKEFCH